MSRAKYAMQASASLVVLATLLGAACGDPATPPPPATGVSPDGLGFCCEPRRVAGCPTLYPGGFGARIEDCSVGWSDLAWTPATRELVDAHGCVYLDRSTAMSCNAPDFGLRDAATGDAGP